MLGKGHGQPLLVIRAISLTVFFFLVASGNATIATMVVTEGLAMGIVIALWVRAWQEKQPGGSLILAAILLSMLAAAMKAPGAQFTLGGWEFDPNSIYHIAQIPGLYLLLVAIQRRADTMERVAPGTRAPWRFQPDLGYYCPGNRLPICSTNLLPGAPSNCRITESGRRKRSSKAAVLLTAMIFQE